MHQDRNAHVMGWRYHLERNLHRLTPNGVVFYFVHVIQTMDRLEIEQTKKSISGTVI